METIDTKQKILILGASGFIGNALYKELCSYYNTFGTYYSCEKDYKNNKHFFEYALENKNLDQLLNTVEPTLIISALRGDFNKQYMAHQQIANYVSRHNCKIVFLSSANVFDAYSQYPSYEFDKTLSNSIYGHFKIKIETLLLQLPPKKTIIARLPMVFGCHSPRLKVLKKCIQLGHQVEVFPNLIMNVTTDSKLTQQLHYIINREKSGIFHLGSIDLVHHDEFIKEMAKNITNKKVSFKQVFTTNEDRYLAVLPKYNKLPKNLQVNSIEVFNDDFIRSINED